MGSLFTAYASLSATLTLLQQAYLQFIPRPLRDRLSVLFHRIIIRRSPRLFTLLVEEYNGLKRNPLFESLEVYLCYKLTSLGASCLKANTKEHGNHAPLALHLARGEFFKEEFRGMKISWEFRCAAQPAFGGRARSKPHYSWNDDYEMEKSAVSDENRFFELSFLRVHKDEFFSSYLPHQVLETADKLMNKDRVLKLWTLKYSGYEYKKAANWESVNLNHPSTFDSLALDPSLKQAIVEDLDRFLGRKEFYKKVGRAWKRGYLLYGPPGTGKSSLIAAIANYLKFDVYDL